MSTELSPQVAVITVPLQEWNETKGMLKSLCEQVTSLTDKENKELLTPKEVCEMLKIGRSTFQRYVDNGDLPVKRITRKKYSKLYVYRRDIERLANNGTLT